jgi:hypothetical protein
MWSVESRAQEWLLVKWGPELELMLEQWYWDDEVGSFSLDALFARVAKHELLAKLVLPVGQLSNLEFR